MMAGVFLLAVLIAPDASSRKAFAVALGIEAALCIYVFVLYVFFQRFF
jgi:hypothetical protein